jgi:hypothetical protein
VANWATLIPRRARLAAIASQMSPGPRPRGSSGRPAARVRAVWRDPRARAAAESLRAEPARRCSRPASAAQPPASHPSDLPSRAQSRGPVPIHARTGARLRPSCREETASRPPRARSCEIASARRPCFTAERIACLSTKAVPTISPPNANRKIVSELA